MDISCIYITDNNSYSILFVTRNIGYFPRDCLLKLEERRLKRIVPLFFHIGHQGFVTSLLRIHSVLSHLVECCMSLVFFILLLPSSSFLSIICFLPGFLENLETLFPCSLLTIARGSIMVLVDVGISSLYSPSLWGKK